MAGPRRSLSAALIVLVVVIAFAGGYVAHRSPTTTTSTPVTTTTADTTWMALWPSRTSAIRYASPSGAARAFAEHVLKMTAPVLRPFQQGDTRSGEVPLQSTPSGPVTTVLVRQLTSDDSWWVIGAIASDITIETPTALTAVTSPLRVSGRSTAYEAVVNLALYIDGSTQALATGTAMGGSMGVVGPYQTTMHYTLSHPSDGTLVVYERSAKDGSVLEASALRLQLG